MHGKYAVQLRAPFFLSSVSLSILCFLRLPRRNAPFNAEDPRKSRYHVRPSSPQRQREGLFNSVCLYKSARVRNITRRVLPSPFLSRTRAAFRGARKELAG